MDRTIKELQSLLKEVERLGNIVCYVDIDPGGITYDDEWYPDVELVFAELERILSQSEEA